MSTEVFVSKPLKLTHLKLAKRGPWFSLTIIALIAGPSLIQLLMVLAEFAYVGLAFPVAQVITFLKPTTRPTHYDMGQAWSQWLHPVGQTRLAWLLTPGAPTPQHTILIDTDVLAAALLLLIGYALYKIMASQRAYRQQMQVSDAHGTAHIAQIGEFGSYALEPRNQWVGSWRMLREAWREQQHLPPLPQTNFIVGREEGTKMLIGVPRMQLETHVLGLGTTGAGKTATQVIPALLRDAGAQSWVATSVKGDLYTLTAGATSRQQRIWHFTLMDPEHSDGFDPLEGVTSFEQATQFAESWVTNTGRSGEDGQFWDREAEKLITMLVWHLRVTEPEACFPRLVELVHLEYEPTRELLEGSSDPYVAMMARKACQCLSSEKIRRTI